MTSRVSLIISVAAALSLPAASFAFVPQNLLKQPARTTQQVFASGFDDDELSKLIGKRDKIKRKKKEELPSEESVLDELGLDDESAIDWDKMPSFHAFDVEMKVGRSNHIC